jgi:hypothetical protein
MVQSVVAAAAVALALPALYVAARVRTRARAADEEELVAVIAAAIAAADGAEPGSFRIVGLRPSAELSEDSDCPPCFSPRPFRAGRNARAGLNTPAWGHVDRFVSRE